MQILSLILLLMASGEEGFNVLSLIIEISTLVHHPIVHLYLLITTMRGKRDVSMHEQCVCEVEHGHFTLLILTSSGRIGEATNMYIKDWLIYCPRRRIFKFLWGGNGMD